jgi:aspartyl-tRNA(Asn)/glutamyl-tRNA(Gln) amidotransferase subunit B
VSQELVYEPVIGLEVHAQLLTKSKMFCSCANSFSGGTNTLICPVCTGQPGALPVINQAAIELGIRAALATQSTIHPDSIFARKNYFYPDLPKGYQISQYEEPYCTGGKIETVLKSGEIKWVGLTRIHFEEDAGKSIHGPYGTEVNLNRAGVPLIEMVSEPDMRSSHEAGQYLRAVHSILKFAGVCDGNMDEGSFRCDANVSVRPRGQSKFGTKVELKNINSFRYVEKAIDFEIQRQIDCLERGEALVQETRSWNSAKGITEPMRAKEQAHDYRYFPEPDLPVLHIASSWIEKVAAELPELPSAKRARFKTDYSLGDYDAGVLTASKELSVYFEEVAALSRNAKAAVNWIANELLGRLNAVGKEIDASPVSVANLTALILAVESGKISGKIAKVVFDEMFVTGKDPESIIQDKGLVQISDPAALEEVVRKIVDANPYQTADYRAGKVKLFAFFIGQAMKETKGQANPALLNELVKKVLGG